MWLEGARPSGPPFSPSLLRMLQGTCLLWDPSWEQPRDGPLPLWVISEDGCRGQQTKPRPSHTGDCDCSKHLSVDCCYLKEVSNKYEGSFPDGSTWGSDPAVDQVAHGTLFFRFKRMPRQAGGGRNWKPSHAPSRGLAWSPGRWPACHGMAILFREVVLLRTPAPFKHVIRCVGPSGSS